VRILAFHSGLHDSVAAAYDDYACVAAVQEERLTREKGSGGLPWLAIDEVLQIAGWTRRDVDAIASTLTEQTAFRSVAQDLYFTTSAAAAAVARRLAEGGARRGGLTAPTQVLGDLDTGVLAGLGISCTPVHVGARIAS